MKKTVPTNFLYIGAAGEHYVISECFRNQREAFKLPIDKGFDLVVTRAYMHLCDEGRAGKAAPAGDETPVYLQVKSRQVTLSAPTVKGERPHWEGCFLIKPGELDLICRTSNAALACVLFVENQGEFVRSRTTFAWWMSSEYVNTIKRSGHFIESADDGSLQLWVRYREPALDTSHDQNPYIALRKQSGSAGAKPGDLASSSLIGAAMFDFSQLGRGRDAGLC